MAKVSVTPKAPAKYAHLVKPDTKWKPEGEWKVTLQFDSDVPEHAAIIEKLDKLHEESHASAVKELIARAEAKGKKLTEAGAEKKLKALDKPYKFDEDEDGEELNTFTISFKMKASGVAKSGKKWKRKPTFLNAKKVELDNPPAVYSGSVLRIGYEPHLFCNPKGEYGVSMRLEVVQILQLAKPGGHDIDEFGFEEEDGYAEVPEEEAEDEAEESEGEADDEDSDADGSDF